jgi:hypothetical protein
MQTPGSTFLHERNPNLHATVEVETVANYLRAGGEAIPNEPADKIAAYLGFLTSEDYVNDGILTGDQASIERQVEAASVALTKDNAEAYVKFQAKVARELGRGGEYDTNQLDDGAKMAALRKIRRDQQLQLSDWVNELNSTENKYPDWFKYWTFNNVTRYTEFNEELGKDGRPKGFEKRSSSSFGLFPALDRESVSLVYDALVEKLGGQPMGFEYDEMRSLLAKADFGELYDEAQNHGFKITDDLKDIKTGGWHDFVQSDHAEDGKALSALVRSYRTGWCTAGLETATTQLQAGDFYVWCSANPTTGKNEVPRIAVRMENGIVTEVRGIVGGRRQELEPGLEDIVMDKIKDLPGGDTYFKKAEDMKRLTALEKNTLANPETELTTDELRFLYELDHDIKGFGYETDPRVKEIRRARGYRDKPELLRIIPESIRAQLSTSTEAYRQVAALLGIEVGPEDVASEFATKDKEWHANGVYDYLAEKLITDGARFTLVATPNTEASEAQIVALAENFGKNQPHATHVYDALYRKGRYSDREWSGNKGNTPIRFSLIPDRFDSEMGITRVDVHAELLRERQARQPGLNIHVPSMQDAVTYWYSLRAGGDKLDDDSAYDKTYIRHFDLEPKLVGGWSIFPRSYVYGGGKSYLNSSVADNHCGARLAVG